MTVISDRINIIIRWESMRKLGDDRQQCITIHTLFTSSGGSSCSSRCLWVRLLYSCCRSCWCVARWIQLSVLLLVFCHGLLTLAQQQIYHVLHVTGRLLLQLRIRSQLIQPTITITNIIIIIIVIIIVVVIATAAAADLHLIQCHLQWASFHWSVHIHTSSLGPHYHHLTEISLGSCVYRINHHCDLQPRAQAVCTFPAAATEPSTRMVWYGMV